MKKMEARYIVMFNNSIIRQQDQIVNEIELMRIDIVPWIIDTSSGVIITKNQKNDLVEAKIPVFEKAGSVEGDKKG